MKMLFISLILSAAILGYIIYHVDLRISPNTSATEPNATSDSSVHGEASQTDSNQEQDQGQKEVKMKFERMVHIHGKWYYYRPDNRYLIDGVPTLYMDKSVAQAPRPEASPSTVTESTVPTKTKKLAQLSQKAPLSVYTPEGFKALKNDLDTMNSFSTERKKALEDLIHEN